MREKNKKYNKRLLLVVLLLIVTIGYATLQTNLTINGTSKINNSTWNVHFETVTPTSGSVTIDTNDNTQYAARIDTNDNTKVGFSVLLNEPGDFYEFTVKAVNSGSIDAMIDTVTKTLKINNELQNSIPAWLTYTATYSDDGEIAKNHILAHDSFETYKIRVELNRDITNAQFLEATGKTLTLEFDVKYVQKGTGATTVNHTFTGTKYSAKFYYDDSIYFNRPIPNNAILHLNAEDAKDEWEADDIAMSRHTYMKYVIQNDILKESYVVLEIDDELKTYIKNYYCYGDTTCEEHADSLNNGVYEFRGGVDERDLSYKPIYIQNNRTLYDAFGGINCDSNPYEDGVYDAWCDFFDQYNGNIERFFVSISSDGNVYTYDGGALCIIKGATAADDMGCWSY